MVLRSKTNLSIDFGTRSIKMVEGSFNKGNLNIINTYFLELPDGLYEDGYIIDKDALKETMDSFLRLNNIKRGNTIALVNSSDILTRDIVLPSASAEEIEGVLKYKIHDYIPIDLENYQVQYLNQGFFMEEGNEKVKIFLIAVPKKLILAHFNLLNELDLKAKILDFQSNAVRKLLVYNEQKNKTSEIDKAVASIDIGFYNTKLTILKNKNIEISRVIPMGLKNVLENINEDEDRTEREILEKIFKLKDLDEEKSDLALALKNFLLNLCASLDMIFRYYNSLENNNNISSILLQGSIVEVKAIIKQVEENLNIKTLSIDSLGSSLTKDLFLYSNAIGSLIRGEKI